jgi:molecular chaperone DnaK
MRSTRRQGRCGRSGSIEAAIAAVKDVLTSKGRADPAKTQALARASMKLGEAMYKAPGRQCGHELSGPDARQLKPDDNVVDAEFSEVDEDKKKGAA